MRRTAIVNARVFDGIEVVETTTVILEGTRILSVGGAVPDDADVVDAAGATLLPGLIDSHVHTSLEGLALALRFGVTTELEMQGTFTKSRRAAVTDDDRLADVRSAGFGITPPGGHPSELLGDDANSDGDEAPWEEAEHADWSDLVMPFSSTPEEAVGFIAPLKAAGSDYIKFMIDDGTVEGAPGLPMLDDATIAGGVGTDVSIPLPALGGMAHGASVHHELQLLVRAGLTPVEALRAATSTPARRFGLADRGRILEGLRADLLLVDGDPTRDISDTLNLRQVWRRGAALLEARSRG